MTSTLDVQAIGPEQAAILAAVLATYDAVHEPHRAGRHFPHDGRRQLRYSIACWQAEEDYRANGCKYLPPDRTTRGRQRTSELLSGLAKAGLLTVDFTAGRASRLRLTRDGDMMARALCGLPMLPTSLGMFHRLCKMLHKKSIVPEWPPTNTPGPRWYRRRHCVWEAGLVWPNGCRDLELAFPPEMLRVTDYMMPLLAAGLVEWYFDTFGWVYWKPTEDAGWDFYRRSDWRTVALDWGPEFDRQLVEAPPSPAAVDIYLSTFDREAEALLSAMPKRSPEIGRIAWGRTDDFRPHDDDDEFFSLLNEEASND